MPANSEFFSGIKSIIDNGDYATQSTINPKVELFAERQDIKRWYEDRIEGIPGDQYISRCTRMVDWWLTISKPEEHTLSSFHTILIEYPESTENYDTDEAADNDIKELINHIRNHYKIQAGSINWLILAEAVVECAVGSLIEINEDIAEDAKTDELREYFTALSTQWDSFYDIAFSPDVVTRFQLIAPIKRNTINISAKEMTSLETPIEDHSSRTEIDAETFNQCSIKALNSITSALGDPAHSLNRVGGFSKIPEDFKFLGLLKHGLLHGYLSKESILLYSCTNAYCVSLLHNFYLLELNENIKIISHEIPDNYCRWTEEDSSHVQKAIEAEIINRIDAELITIEDLSKSKPSTFKISLERKLGDALDMTLAGLREAITRSAGIESSSGIKLIEIMTNIMHAYAPVTANYLMQPISSPLGIKKYELEAPCINAISDLISNPKQLLEDIFDLWPDLYSSSTDEHKECIKESPIAETEATEVVDFATKTMLKGKALISKVSELDGEPPEFQARSCGYLTSDHPYVGDVEAFYAALYEAYRA
jgi:hypothetical protein